MADTPRTLSTLIAQLADIKKVFQYHGAEHKAIAAYEKSLQHEPSRLDGYLDAARACILDVGWRRTTLTEVAGVAFCTRMKRPSAEVRIVAK